MFELRFVVTIPLAILLWVGATAAEPARTAFASRSGPSSQVPEPIGGYAKGCLAGGQELPETAPSWQAMRLGRNRNWGHPELVAFVERLADGARTAGWPRIYVGDISQPRGGPMRSGHRSHQIGLDADIWLLRPQHRPLTRDERERIGSPSVVASNRREVNASWTPSHHAVLKAAASDPAVARIFVNAAIKKALCNAEPGQSDGWLRKIRPWWGHDSHFHVRLHCPAGTSLCEPQEEVPPGDGCGAELDWWFTDEALNPPPPPVAPRELQVADLPTACRRVLE